LARSARPPVIRTPDQRLRVFVSSTMRELAAERAAVAEAVRALRLAPVLFELGARPHPPRDLYVAYVQQSDIFIGIYGREYGWVGPGMDISGIEDEYLLASGKPRLLYVKTVEARDERLKAMLERIASQADVSYKRFSTPEELAELVANDLALLLSERFQPTPLPATPHQEEEEGVGPLPAATLPAFTTRLIGREREVAEVAALLERDDVRLLTLTGPGGTGKTRLAVQGARELASRQPWPVHYVSLAAVREPSLVVSAIAGTLRVHESDARPLLELLQEYLRRRRLLLVLDNFEQVIGAGVHLAELLRCAPELKLLVTSREPLQVYGEREYPVSPLAVPDAGAGDQALADSPAVQLFLERALAVRPDLPQTSATLSTAARICARLDGLPLAIELAAAWVRFLSPETVLERLSDRLGLLTRGPRDLPERQRTMRAAIAWSYDLLGPPEQALFRRLSVFAGSFSLDAAEAIANPEGELGLDTLDGLASLASKNVLRTVDFPDGDLRFEMLALVRAFAAEKLTASGEMALLRDRHCQFFAHPVGDEDSSLIGVEARALVERSEQTYPNWREAISWGVQCLEAGREPPDGLETILVYLPFYWYLSGRLSEGRELAEGAVRAAQASGDQRVLASALGAAGAMALWQGDIAQARRYQEESLAIWRRLGTPVRLRQALMWFGQTAVNQGEAELARRALEEALALAEMESCPTPRLGIVLMHLGDAAMLQGEYQAAEEYFQRGLANQREVGAPWGVASLLNDLGEVARCRGDYPTARRYYQEALDIFSRMDSAGDVARCHHSLGYLALREGDVDQAQRLFATALDEFCDFSHRRGIAEAIQGLAGVAVARGAYRTAARLLGASQRMVAEVQAHPWPADRLERERDLRSLEEALGAGAIAEAMAQGQLLAPAEAIAEARRL